MSARQHRLLDGSAIGLSFLCLLHCLALPLALSAAPIAGLAFGDDHLVHMLFFAMAFPISAVGLILGARRNGTGWELVVLGGSGLFFMLSGLSHLWGEAWVSELTVIGVLFVGTAHLFNWRRSVK